MLGKPLVRTPEQKQQVVLELLLERDTLAGIAHHYGLSIFTIIEWKDAFLRNDLDRSLQRAAS
jgi:transposase-like protein